MTRIVPTTESQAERIAYLEKALDEQTAIADLARCDMGRMRRVLWATAIVFNVVGILFGAVATVTVLRLAAWL